MDWKEVNTGEHLSRDRGKRVSKAPLEMKKEDIRFLQNKLKRRLEEILRNKMKFATQANLILRKKDVGRNQKLAPSILPRSNANERVNNIYKRLQNSCESEFRVKR